MKFVTALISLASAVLLASQAEAAPVVAGYLLLNPTNGPAKLQALAANAASIPVNRIYLSFARPGMVYVPGSNTLANVGLDYATSGDYGYADIKTQVGKLIAGGVEVFLSVGGWNYGCFPFMYTYYSVGGYGTATPNYYKIAAYGSSLANCNESNMWCYTCEPASENTTLASFDIFPEPAGTSTWSAAQAYVVSKAGAEAPVWNDAMAPGSTWKEPVSGQTIVVPGNNYYATQGRDPYQDLVYLAKDLGLSGVDIDYEEMWHADYHKVGPAAGPWTSHQTVYKYAALMYDVMQAIKTISPTLKLSTAASAAGGLSTNWWGGNLKNIWYNLHAWYPDVYNFMVTGANAGGVNVMTYDLSNNQQYSECPDANTCTLSQQVIYYMNSYASNGMTATVGYEIGQPAYPDFTHDPTHQLPLIQSEFTTILNSLGSKGGFFWELYKPQANSANVEVTSAAQQICKAALGASTARCSGVIPQIGGTTTTTGSATSTTVATSTTTVASSTTKVSTTTTTTTTKASTTTTTTAATTTTGSSGKCTGVQTWTSTGIYTGGTKVQYQGNLYTAAWWTQGEVPGTTGQWGVWSAPTAC